MSFSADTATEDLAKKFKVAQIVLYFFVYVVGLIAGVSLGVAIYLTIELFESTHTILEIPDFWIKSPSIIGAVVGGLLVFLLVGFVDNALNAQKAMLLSESQ